MITRQARADVWVTLVASIASRPQMSLEGTLLGADKLMAEYDRRFPDLKDEEDLSWKKDRSRSSE